MVASANRNALEDGVDNVVGCTITLGAACEVRDFVSAARLSLCLFGTRSGRNKVLLRDAIGPRLFGIDRTKRRSIQVMLGLVRVEVVKRETAGTWQARADVLSVAIRRTGTDRLVAEAAAFRVAAFRRCSTAGDLQRSAVVAVFEQGRRHDGSEAVDHETVGNGWDVVFPCAAKKCHCDGDLDGGIGFAAVEQELSRLGAAGTVAIRVIAASSVERAMMVRVMMMMMVVVVMTVARARAGGGWVRCKFGKVDNDVAEDVWMSGGFDIGGHFLANGEFEFRICETAPGGGEIIEMLFAMGTRSEVLCA